ncbi:penicillin-binding protein activator [Sphingomonas sp. GCM10030256]|uniref:penicillin-binding protein activator n=1 Tax=Sphingomonas sp. GCM10030256 TaxID=3273427 RepID=UPI00360B0802
MTPTLPSPQARHRFAFVAVAVGMLMLANCRGGPRADFPRPEPGVPSVHEVAVLVPMTGPDAAVGGAIANAAQLALQDSGNRSIRLSLYDTMEAGAAAAASRAIGDGSRLILGPLLADEARAVAPIARRARVPVISYSNDVTVAGDGVYILGFVPGQAIERVIGHARQAGAVRFAGLVPANPYGQRSSEALLAGAQRSGGQVVRVETYARPEDARAAARRLNAAGGFDAALIAEGGRPAAAAAPQIRAGPRLLGSTLWAGDRTLGRIARLRGAWFAAPSDTRFGQFASRYKARYDASPVRLATLGYDSVLLTVRAARDWSLGRRFPERGLLEGDGYEGVDGIFRFGRNGIVQRAFEVRQVTAGGSTVVSPAPAHF